MKASKAQIEANQTSLTLNYTKIAESLAKVHSPHPLCPGYDSNGCLPCVHSRRTDAAGVKANCKTRCP